MRPGNHPSPPPQIRWWKVVTAVFTPLAGLLVVWAGLLARDGTPQVLGGVLLVAVGIWMLVQTATQHREYRRYVEKYPQHRP
jgi:hypothetical protein